MVYFSKLTLSCFILCVISDLSDCSIFDQDLYERVINDTACEEQIRNMMSNPGLIFQYMDSSAKMPSGMSGGNLNDYGNYYECLKIAEEVNGLSYEGKYCMLSFPLDGVLDYLEDKNETVATTYRRKVERYGYSLKLAYCIPKVCSVDAVLEHFNGPINATYEVKFCRLPNDKPFVTADIVGWVIVAILLGLVLLSSTYELVHTFYLRTEKRLQSTVYSSFSVYGNGRKLFRVSKPRGAIQCLDGVRVLSSLWVIYGHSFLFHFAFYSQNLVELSRDVPSFWNLHRNCALFSVDTFFAISGMVLVYSQVSKHNTESFVKSLHLYLANRYLRMVPILAAVIVFQACFVNHISDGPAWNDIAKQIEECRDYWWRNLLFIQNFFGYYDFCVAHSWFLAIDFQVYLVAPFVIVFLFGSKIKSLVALVCGFIISLTTCTVLCFKENYKGSLLGPGPREDQKRYFINYYMSPFTRSPPFFLGMIFGYFLYLTRKTALKIPRMVVFMVWFLALACMLIAFASNYPAIQSDYVAIPMLNLFLNGFSHSLWALGVCWLILACHIGYGGPINWFLSLNFWNIPAKLAYGMYLMHLLIQQIIASSYVTTRYYRLGFLWEQFISNTVISAGAAIVLMLLVDLPCDTLQKKILGNDTPKKRAKPNDSRNGAGVGAANQTEHVTKTA